MMTLIKRRILFMCLNPKIKKYFCNIQAKDMPNSSSLNDINKLSSSITISDSCTRRIEFLLNKNPENKFLRLMVEGGGCSGYQYIFKMDNKINDDDIIIKKDDVQIVIDKLSLPFLEGALIDYKETLIKASFTISDNPKAEISCSCGSSFSPKLNNNL